MPSHDVGTFLIGVVFTRSVFAVLTWSFQSFFFTFIHLWSSFLLRMMEVAPRKLRFTPFLGGCPM